jgi:hypothetical protein
MDDLKVQKDGKVEAFIVTADMRGMMLEDDSQLKLQVE